MLIFKRVSLGGNVEKVVIKYFLKCSGFRINFCRTVAKFHAKGPVLKQLKDYTSMYQREKKIDKFGARFKASLPKYIDSSVWNVKEKSPRDN